MTEHDDERRALRGGVDPSRANGRDDTAPPAATDCDDETPAFDAEAAMSAYDAFTDTAHKAREAEAMHDDDEWTVDDVAPVVEALRPGPATLRLLTDATALPELTVRKHLRSLEALGMVDRGTGERPVTYTLVRDTPSIKGARRTER